MIHYCKIDFSKEGIDLEKRSKSRKCDVCRFHFFIEEDLKYHLNLFTCNECLNLLIKTHYLSCFFIEGINNEYYCCYYSGIAKDKAVEIIKSTEKKRVL